MFVLITFKNTLNTVYRIIYILLQILQSIHALHKIVINIFLIENPVFNGLLKIIDLCDIINKEIE